MKARTSTMFLGSILALGMAAPACAQNGETEDRTSVTIGLGGGVVPSYAGSDDYVATPGLLIRGKVDNFAFFTRGTNLFVDLVRDPKGSTLDLSFGPMINYRGDRTGRIKDDQVKALGKLDNAWELGGWAGISKTGVITSAYDVLSFRVSYAHDVAGAHESYMITPAIEYGTPLSRTSYVGLSISADYVGKGFGHYYYDISSADALASDLAVYSAAGRKAGFSRFNLGLFGAQSLSDDIRRGWAVFAVGSYGRMLGRYKDSPIVTDAGSPNQWLGGAGLAYSF